MASAISALMGAAGQAAAARSATAQTAGAPPSKEMFLQLLVAQIKNQDPLKPMDSTQFVAQLAQFSELEQIIGIRQDIEGAASSTPATQN